MRFRLLARPAVVALVVLGLATTMASAEESVTLRLRPQADVSYAYVLTQEQDAEITMGAFGTQTTSTRTRMDLRERVVERSDDSVTMELVYDRVRIEATAVGQTTTFDSASTGAGGEGGDDVLSRIVGRPVRFTATERAIVTDVEGFDAWFDAMVAGEADTDPAAAPIVAMLRQSFGDEAMGQMLQQGLPVLPEAAVAPGATWAFTLDMSNPAVGTMRTHQEFELQGFEERAGRSCARVAVALAMEHDGEFPILDRLRETFSAQGQQVDLAIDLGTAEGTGTLWLDLATGMPVAMQSRMRLDMVMNLSAPGAPDAPPGGAMEMRMSTAVRQDLALVDDRTGAETSKILD